MPMPLNTVQQKLLGFSRLSYTISTMLTARSPGRSTGPGPWQVLGGLGEPAAEAAASGCSEFLLRTERCPRAAGSLLLSPNTLLLRSFLFQIHHPVLSRERPRPAAEITGRPRVLYSPTVTFAEGRTLLPLRAGKLGPRTIVASAMTPARLRSRLEYWARPPFAPAPSRCALGPASPSLSASYLDTRCPLCAPAVGKTLGVAGGGGDSTPSASLVCRVPGPARALCEPTGE